MREILLVSKPRHSQEIKGQATIAFIEFNHIEYLLFQDHKRNVCASQVAAALAQHLMDLNQYKIVTREHIGTVLDEVEFGRSGNVNSRTASKLGELIGADILIYGLVQLCVPERGNDDQGPLPRKGDRELSLEAVESSVISDLLKKIKPAKERALIIAQIQLIEAETGRQVFTTSLEGNYEHSDADSDYEISNRELISKAADDLANDFIDNFLARREARYMGLYSSSQWGFDEGIDIIQLGDCSGAEAHFRDVYSRHKLEMGKPDLAKLMYNHGVSLMCSNQPEAALERLWASLRLAKDPMAFEAIKFTNDVVDRGRVVMAETDPIIEAVRKGELLVTPQLPELTTSGPLEETAANSDDLGR